MGLIGKNLKHLRQIHRLNQEEFAQLFDLNRGNIASYESGAAEPKINTLLQISQHFEIPMEDLVSKDLSAQNSSYPSGTKSDIPSTGTALTSGEPYITRLDTVESALKQEIGRLSQAISEMKTELKQQGEELARLKHNLPGK